MKNLGKCANFFIALLAAFYVSLTVGMACSLGHSKQQASVPALHSIELHLKEWTELVEKVSTILLAETTRASGVVDQSNVKKGVKLIDDASRILDEINLQDSEQKTVIEDGDKMELHRTKIAVARKYMTLLNKRFALLSAH